LNNINKIDLDTVELVKELDGLFLALSTVGVYLEYVLMTLLDYLWLYKKSWSKLQITSP